MTTDTDFATWITEHLDQILHHERPIRYGDMEEIWRGRISEIDMFCGMWLGDLDSNVYIH